jgi:DegV family protein with EDD domain
VPTVAVVTDSTSDIDAATAAELGVDVVPLSVIFGDQRYLDGVEITHRQFFERMAAEKQLPITSQPTAAAFEAAFAPHAQAGRPILGIFLAQYFSGTINAARAASQQFPEADVSLFDSQTICGGLGLLVRRAAAMSARGAAKDEILAELERARSKSCSLATIPDLTHAVRTGRVSKAQAALGNVFKIVPVLRIAPSAVEEEAKVRTFARAIDTMIDVQLKHLGTGRGAEVMVAHADAPETANRMLETLRGKFSEPPDVLSVVEAGPVISVHTGPGTVAIFSIAG